MITSLEAQLADLYLGADQTLALGFIQNCSFAASTFEGSVVCLLDHGYGRIWSHSSRSFGLLCCFRPLLSLILLVLLRLCLQLLQGILAPISPAERAGYLLCVLLLMNDPLFHALSM